MNEERLKKEFEKMDTEDVEKLSEDIEEPSNAERAGRVLARVYEKTGVAQSETPIEDLPERSEKTAHFPQIRVRILAAVAAAVLVIAFALSVSIALIGKSAPPIDTNVSEETLSASLDTETPSPSDAVSPDGLSIYYYEISGSNVADFKLNSDSLAESSDFIKKVESETLDLQSNSSVNANDATICFYSNSSACNVIYGNVYLFRPQNVVLSDGIEIISSDAFKNCTMLTSIYIPANVRVIESGTFDDCSALKVVVISADNPVYAVKDGKIVEKETGNVIFDFSDKTE